MSDKLQRRYVTRAAKPIRVQERSDGAAPLITGYASVFYREGDRSTEYELGPGLVERIAPAAFDRAVKDDDVRALFNHDEGVVLGRTSAGTLRLVVDEVGLRYDIDPPDTTAARDLIASLRRGDVSGSSFSFVDADPELNLTQEDRDGRRVQVVTRKNLRLFDVGPVTFPAYTGAAAHLRADRAGAESVRAEIEAAERLAARDLDAVLLAVAEMEFAGADE